MGRTLRQHEGKQRVDVYDYVDNQVPVLKKMFFKRRKTYKAMGFGMEEVRQLTLL